MLTLMLRGVRVGEHNINWSAGKANGVRNRFRAHLPQLDTQQQWVAVRGELGVHGFTQVYTQVYSGLHSGLLRFTQGRVCGKWVVKGPLTP